MKRSKPTQRKERRGVATVELAFVLPAFIALVFGSIEICQRLHVKQSTLIAAYEACRVATRPISDTAIVQTHCETLLAQQNVNGATVQIWHKIDDPAPGEPTGYISTLDGVKQCDEIRIRVTVPWDQNTISHYVIGDMGETFEVQAFMLRE